MATSRRRSIWAVAAIVAVAISIAAALAHLGSPAERRKHWLDDSRVSRLKQIATDLDTHLERNGELPADLAALANTSWAAAVTFDPVTQQPFDYEVLGSRHYRLCATFARPTPPLPHDRATDFWHHPEGRHCYEFERSEPSPDPCR